MIGSSLVLGVLGLVGTFMPDAVVGHFGAPVSAPLVLLSRYSARFISASPC